MGATPLTILLIGTINFARALSRRGTIVLQVLASLVLWILLTYGVVLIFMMMVFNATYPSSTIDDWKMTGWFLLAGLVYTIAGAALVYWTKRQAKLSQTLKTSP